MKIKNRLSVQFSAVAATIIAVVFVILYWISSENRINDFYTRVKDRALTTAQIFLAQDNFTKEKYQEVQRKYKQGLPGEIVRMFDENNHPVFLDENNKYWSNEIIDKVRSKGYLSYREGERQITGIYYADRLKEITNSLLELAQTSFENKNALQKPVRIDELLWDIREEWINKSQSFELVLHFDQLPQDENELLVAGNRSFCRRCEPGFSSLSLLWKVKLDLEGS